jgi:hypothetical protein
LFGINQQFDAAGHPWLSSDEARALQRQHHLMHGGLADTKILLHVGFGRCPSVQASVEVDVGQILGLLGCEVLPAKHIKASCRWKSDDDGGHNTLGKSGQTRSHRS